MYGSHYSHVTAWLPWSFHWVVSDRASTVPCKLYTRSIKGFAGFKFSPVSQIAEKQYTETVLHATHTDVFHCCLMTSSFLQLAVKKIKSSIDAVFLLHNWLDADASKTSVLASVSVSVAGSDGLLTGVK